MEDKIILYTGTIIGNVLTGVIHDKEAYYERVTGGECHVNDVISIISSSEADIEGSTLYLPGSWDYAYDKDFKTNLEKRFIEELVDGEYLFKNRQENDNVFISYKGITIPRDISVTSEVIFDDCKVIKGDSFYVEGDTICFPNDGVTGLPGFIPYYTSKGVNKICILYSGESVEFEEIENKFPKTNTYLSVVSNPETNEKTISVYVKRK